MKNIRPFLLCSAVMIIAGALLAQAPVATVPALPPGASVEWDSGKAWRLESETRGKISLNGLWRFRSAVLVPPAPILFETYENDLEGWVFSPGDKFKATRDTGERRNGAASLRLDFNMPKGENFYHFTRSVAAKGETVFLLSAWVKTAFESGYMAFEVQDGRNSFGKENKIFMVKTGEKRSGVGDWKKVELEFRTPAGCEKLLVRVRHLGDGDAAKGRCWIDDLVIQEPQADMEGVVPPTDARWGFAKVPGSAKSDAFTTYWHAEDPGAKNPKGQNTTWYERELTPPPSWNGRRLFLDFERAGNLLMVFVDGVRVARLNDLGGKVEITDRVKPGKTLRLSVFTAARDPRDPSEKYMAFKPGEAGIPGDVSLESQPMGPATGAFRIETSVREREIRVHARLEGTGAPEGTQVECEITRDGKRVKVFRAPVPEGATSLVAASPWKDADLWDIGKPVLYRMQVSLVAASGKLLDRSLPARFGFREFEIRGKYFYLNGVKVNLRPCAYYVQRPSWASTEVIHRWFDRILEEGHNFVYCETVDIPGRPETIRAVLDEADARGVLMAITPTQINDFRRKLDDPALLNWYTGRLRARAERVWNHPALVLWRMNMNLNCYEQDQSPYFLDSHKAPDPGTPLALDFEAAARSSALLAAIDPSRPSYHHASGDMTNVYTLNNYLCWPVPQDLREWLSRWAEGGKKPLMMVEFDLPYPGSFLMNDPTSWWMNEPLVTEHGAILLGEEAYGMQEDDDALFSELAWNAKAKKWESAYGYFCHGLPAIIDRCSAYYYKQTLPAWRTWGIPGGVNGWEYTPTRTKKRAEKPASYAMRTPHPSLPVENDWARLQVPGFHPDFFQYASAGNGHIQAHTFPGVADESNYFEPTEWGRVMKDLNRALYAYVGGPGKDWPEQDHAFASGETVKKSVVLINDLREAAVFSVSWQAILDGKTIGEGKGAVTVAPAEVGQWNLDFKAPGVDQRRGGEIRVQVKTPGGAVPVEAFAFQVFPPLTALAPTAGVQGWGLYDPKGRTASALGRRAVKLAPIGAERLPAGLKVLVIGCEALDPAAPPAFLGELPERVAGGLQVLFFEQTTNALEHFFRLRTVPRSTRNTLARDASHPFLRGLTNADLADWRGSTTLSPLEGEAARLTESQRWKRAWRCSQRGVVSSVMVEKPQAGPFHPIVDGEFDLRYMMLWEVFEGAGRLVFCQLDVTDRLGLDPAADRVAANVFSDLSSWKAPAVPKAALALGDDARTNFLPFGLDIPVNPEAAASGLDTLVLGPGSAGWLGKNGDAVRRLFASGGRVLAVGLKSADAQALAALSGNALKFEEKKILSTPVKGFRRTLRGLSPADLTWREWKTVLSLHGEAAVEDLAVGKGTLSSLAAVPQDFDPGRRPDLVFTRNNVSRSIALALANLGLPSRIRWTALASQAAQASRENWEQSLAGTWRMKRDPDGKGPVDAWIQGALDERGAGWVDLKVPGMWGESQPDWNGWLGDAWHRFHFAMPAKLKGRPLEFYAKAIDDVDEVWINGKKIGETTRKTPQWWVAERRYPIPDGLLRFDGENLIVVRINNNNADAGFDAAVCIRVPVEITTPPAAHYLDKRVPRDDPYATMRW